MNKLCVLLIGVPAVGKTTFRNNLLTMRAMKGQETLPAWTSISSDDIIEQYAKQRGETYAEAWPNYIQQAQDMSNAQLKYAVDFGDGVIVVDRTHTSRVSRARTIDLVKDRDPSYKFIALDFKCRTAEWDKRLRNRPGKEIPELALKRMVTSYQTPTEDEGFSHIEKIDTTSGQLDIKKYYDLILNMMDGKAP